MNHFALRVITLSLAGAVLCNQLTAMELQSNVPDELASLLSLPLSSLKPDEETSPLTNREEVTEGDLSRGELSRGELSRLRQYQSISSIEDERQGLNELHRAARYGFVNDIKTFCKKYDLHDQTKDQLTALHLAASFGHDAVIAELLAQGAQVNATTQEGLTALHLAALWGYFPVVARLISAGSDVNMVHTTMGLPLHCAAQQGCAATVALLLETTSGIDVPDASGWTPLLHAALQGHTDCALILLEKGASRENKASGLTAQEWAQAKGHIATAHALQSFSMNQRRSRSTELTESLRSSFDGVLPQESSDLSLGITTSYDGKKRTPTTSPLTTPRSPGSGTVTPRVASPRPELLTPRGSARTLQESVLRNSARSPRSGPNSPRKEVSRQSSSTDTSPRSETNSSRINIRPRSQNASSPTLSSPKGAHDAEARRKSLAKSLHLNQSLEQAVKRSGLTVQLLHGTACEKAVIAGVEAVTGYLIKTLKSGVSKIDELDSKGYGLIHYALHHEKEDVLEYLLSEGASADLKTGDFKTGLTPLIVAAKKRFLPGIVLLLRSGARVQPEDGEKAFYDYFPKAIEGAVFSLFSEALLKPKPTDRSE